MKSALMGFLLLLVQASSIFAAPPDPRDSIILESKFTSPIVGTGGVVRLRVWITNKDSLSFVTLVLIETSISNGAYLILSRPRNFNGMVNRLTATLTGQSIFNVGQPPQPAGARYNSASPDSFLFAPGFDPFDPTTIEPPNASRKALLDIKFDSAIVNSNAIGLVSFDTGRVVQSTIFTSISNGDSRDLPVNFVKSTVLIGTSPFLQLIAPPQGISVVQKQPSFIWSSLRDSALNIIPASYKVFISIDSDFVSADSSLTVPETTWRTPDTLASGLRYYWKVLAITDNGDSTFSADTRFFNIVPNTHAPGGFNLIYPPNGSKIVRKNITFDWSNSPDMDPYDTVKYTFYISSESSFVDGFTRSDISFSNFPIPQGILTRGAVYFWRVKAADTQGNSVFSNNLFRFHFLKQGDANGDDELSPADIVLVLKFLYLSIPTDPFEVSEMNCDGSLTSADLVILLNRVFFDEPPVCDL